MAGPTAAELEIAALRARVAALEQALARRSAELRRLQQILCRDDLAALDELLAESSQVAGLGFDPLSWQETHRMRPAEVEETLRQLWASLTAAGGDRRGE